VYVFFLFLFLNNLTMIQTPSHTDLRNAFLRLLRTLRHLCLCGLFLPALSCIVVLAQTPCFEHISIEQGLSSANVHRIFQDRTGMLWFGTEDGLNMYDGHSFKVFRQTMPDSLGLGAQSVKELFEDSERRLWLATENTRTVSLFSPLRAEFDILIFPNGEECSAQAFFETESKAIMIGTSRGLFLAQAQANTAEQTFLTLRRVNAVSASLDIRGIAPAAKDSYWLICSDGVYRYNPEAKTCAKSYAVEGKSPRTFFAEYEVLSRDSVSPYPAYLWIGSAERGLFILHLASGSIEKIGLAEGLASNTVNALCARSRDEVWVGTENGISCLTRSRLAGFSLPRRWKVAYNLTHDIRNKRSIAGNVVRDIFQDKSSLVWVGTAYYGVSKYSRYRHKFAYYGVNLLKENASLNSGYVRGIVEDGTYLWIATQTGGLNRYNQETGKWAYFRSREIGSDTAWSLVLDAKSRLWLGTVGSGVWTWEGKQRRFQRFPLIPPQSNAQLLYEDKRGKLWVSGKGAPLYCVSADRASVREYDLSDLGAASGGGVTDVIRVASGQTLVGFASGLYELDEEKGTFRRIIADVFVRDIEQDANGDIWIGSRGQGLLRYRLPTPKSLVKPVRADDSSVIRFITEREGLPSNVVSAILPHSPTRLWISSKQGLAEINTETLKVLRNFSVTDGLQGREFHHMSAFKNLRGEMFFGGVNGLNRFHPDDVPTNAIAPPVAITSVKKFGRDEVLTDSAVAASRLLRLRFDENSISFSFVALDYHAPDANVYAYQMEGLDKGWIQCGSRREATYTSLDPGTYKFSVRAANNDGVWSEHGAEFTVVIEPPVWRTWWFLGLSVASAVCVGFVAYRARIRSIEARNVWLEKQVQERTAEIKEKNNKLQQSLDEIQILSSILESERNKSEDLLLNILPPSIAERLKWGETTIVDTFDSATVLFTDMVGFTKIASRVSAEELITILNRMFSEFDKIAEKHGVEKIKTIGDAYMAVAGVPIPNEFHAAAVADMALDIMQSIKDLAKKENLPIMIRAGIHTGCLTAGVIGEKKFVYDLWGDTVNTASRMESSGEAGRIQCSEATYEALKDLFDFEERGTIEVKGKGAMKTYFLLGRKQRFS
jgi:class 3 adenylate cyclase/ligand-binding sensor domain-containing protein